MTKRFPTWVNDLLYAFLSATAIATLMAAFSKGNFWTGWLAFEFIALPGVYLLIQLWRKLGCSRNLAALMLVTLGIRMAVGIFIFATLPTLGYSDNPMNQAGFVYSDAYNRDSAALALAQSDQPLYSAFTHPDISDQYGGLLFLNSLLYRTLSPDASRPLLLALLSMIIMTAGVAFLWSAVQKRWPARVALYAGWVLALFPDSVLLGSSQMREPIIIGLGCLAFWAMLGWKEKPMRAGVLSLLSIVLIGVFSLPAGGIYAVILLGLFLLEWTMEQKVFSRRYFGYILLALLAIVTVVAGWFWLRETLYYDAFITRTSSGWITKLIKGYGKKWTIPFTTIYGLTQPLLPAAIFDPSRPIWTSIAIYRSLGWWCILPYFLYGLTSTWMAPKKKSTVLFHTLALIFAAWVLVSSMRAGGDLWDNPRYRYMLLPFMSLIIAWACVRFSETRSPWFWRWLAVEVVFLLFFGNFYLNRFVVGFGTQLPFNTMVLLILGLSVLILAGGLVIDLVKRKRSQPKE